MSNGTYDIIIIGSGASGGTLVPATGSLWQEHLAARARHQDLFRTEREPVAITPL